VRRGLRCRLAYGAAFLAIIAIFVGTALLLRQPASGEVAGHVIQYQCMGTVPCFPLPARGRNVAFTSEQSGKTFLAPMDQNGYYSIGLQAGACVISIRPAPSCGTQDFKGLSTIDRGARTVSVQPNKLAVVDHQMCPNET
jgi:hypothetical protein